jgi:hypothetical protein
MHITIAPNERYAYIPGIMGSRAGKRHVSAGVLAAGDKKTAIVPAANDEMAVATTMLTLPDMSMNRNEWAAAAITAQ